MFLAVRRLVARTFDCSLLGVLMFGACATAQQAEEGDSALSLPDAAVTDAARVGDVADASRDASRDAMAPVDAAFCAQLGGAQPRSISDVVSRLNQLPEPASIPCLVASLPRPLSLVTSVSASSAQPAADATSPRIFILFETLTMSVVATGAGKDLLEFGEWVEAAPGGSPQSTKAELEFPVSRPVSDEAPYLRVAGTDSFGSPCGSCHPSQVQHKTIPHAFVSDALRVARYYEQPVAALRAVRTRCDSEELPQCELLRALFDHGEVSQGAFGETVRLGF